MNETVDDNYRLKLFSKVHHGHSNLFVTPYKAEIHEKFVKNARKQ